MTPTAVASLVTTEGKNDIVIVEPDEDVTEFERRFAVAYVEQSLLLGSEKGATASAYRRVKREGKLNNEADTDNASKLMQKPSVSRYIAKIRAAVSGKALIPAGHVIQEIERIAFANLMDYFAVDKNGEPSVDLSDISPEQAAAIGEIEVTETFKPPGRKIKIKLYDKLAALEKLARIHGLIKPEMNFNLTLQTVNKAIAELEKELGLAPGATIEGSYQDVTGRPRGEDPNRLVVESEEVARTSPPEAGSGGGKVS